ncbi:uncharacterized protein LOC130725360 [Lotus japonicus]|uniref:uncharacterized protein LOC130725360 n=1 Tax=Lotus japonicus TaxID=34305 RepID=UPI00258FA3B5|nr:uncharacterized protein LOC130725360 [Lotus japonicus]
MDGPDFLDVAYNGDKIEFSAKNNLITKFKKDLTEGKVYRISHFAVATNSGFFMASNNEFNINFVERTKVVLEEASLIPMSIFTIKNSEEIRSIGGDYNYLIDMIGLVTNVSKEKQYSKGGYVTRMIELELTDDRGKNQCALFGNYVDVVKGFLSSDGYRMTVVIVQFVKIKTFMGDVVIQNVMNATNVISNSDTEETASFRDG